MQKFLIVGLAATALLSFSACEANLNANVSPSPAASASPAADPSSSPSAGVNAGANVGINVPGVSVGGNASGSSTLNPNAPLTENGALIVTGSDVFNQYKINFTKGMKWVYGMKTTVGGISIPGFPGGTPATTMDLGTFSMEVVDVQGDLITFETDTNITAPNAPKVEPKRTTVKKESFSKLYVEGFQNAGKGTLNWSSAAGASQVSVPAGSYATEMILGKAIVTLESSPEALNQDIKLWMNKDIGMVKEEVLSKITTSGFTVDSTTVIELNSFTK